MFKVLTLENWRERDPANENFSMPSGAGMRPMTGDDWAELFLSVELTPKAPAPVSRLFAVARGVLVYGEFFYPLYYLGAEQLYRVADAAALVRYDDLGGARTKRGEPPVFATRIRWLHRHGVITDARHEQWHGFRELRNRASHPEEQQVFTPGTAVSVLREVSDCIAELFEPPTLRTPE